MAKKLETLEKGMEVLGSSRPVLGEDENKLKKTVPLLIKEN